MRFDLPENLTPYLTILPEGIDKFAAFGEMVRNCTVFDEISSKDAFLEAVIRREKLQSTGIGHGVAIAHGKVPHLSRTHIALGVSPDGIFFDDMFEEPVRLLFLIASCPTKQADYVKALASLLTWVHDMKLRDELEHFDFTRERCNRFLEMMVSQRFYTEH